MFLPWIFAKPSAFIIFCKPSKMGLVPYPPSLGLLAHIHLPHTSRHFAYHFTIVLKFSWPIFVYCLHWSSVKLCTKCQTIQIIACIERWLLPIKVPSRKENFPQVHFLPFTLRLQTQNQLFSCFSWRMSPLAITPSSVRSFSNSDSLSGSDYTEPNEDVLWQVELGTSEIHQTLPTFVRVHR